MRLREIRDALDLTPVCCPTELDREVTGGYASDLMSDVIAHGEEGDLWITLQTHTNVVAVAVMKGLAAIVLTGGREPEPETAARAEAEGVPVLKTDLPAFQLIGRLYAMGVGR